MKSLDRASARGSALLRQEGQKKGCLVSSVAEVPRLQTICVWDLCDAPTSVENRGRKGAGQLSEVVVEVARIVSESFALLVH